MCQLLPFFSVIGSSLNFVTSSERPLVVLVTVRAVLNFNAKEPAKSRKGREFYYCIRAWEPWT